jgi:hypothetical protein
MILDLEWRFNEDGTGEAKLWALVAEVAGYDECGDIHTTRRSEWEEVRVRVPE